MDILELIKNTTAIRKYRNRCLPRKIIEKIIEAGIWAPSIHGFQPWKFTVITQRKLIKQISSILIEKSKSIGTGPNILLHSTANTLADAPAIIVVYNTEEFLNFANKFNKESSNNAKIAEIQAIGALLQNMQLAANTLKIGTCWFGIPLFCEKEIKELLNEQSKLMAILSLGYPAEKGKRAKRKPIIDTVRYIQ